MEGEDGEGWKERLGEEMEGEVGEEMDGEVGRGMAGEVGVSSCKLRHIERINNQVLLYSTKNSIPYAMTDCPGVPVAETPCSQCRGLGLISDQGTRSHTLQTKSLRATVKDPKCLN